MLILFDNGSPWPLRRFLIGHTCRHAYQLGWHRLANGALIANAEKSGYEMLITTDQEIQYQQNLAVRRIAILVLVGHNWPYSQARINAIVSAVEEMGTGDYREVTII